MIIGGLLKSSFSDYPGRMAAVVFTRGCDFRCPWCHNPHLVDPSRYVPEVPLERVLRFLDNRRRFLDAVVVSGGEPTVQPDLLWLLRELKSLGYAVKLDTNGSRPDVVWAALGLVDCLAVDYKLPFGQYRKVGFRGDPLLVRESVTLALSSPKGYIRTTVVPGIHTAEVLEWMKVHLWKIGFAVEPGSSKWKLQKFRANGELLEPGFTKIA
jgi:pyruvate formate lyase activating enzyme